MEELEQGRTYLLKCLGAHNLLSATILVVTNNAYHIRWNLGIKSEEEWHEKKFIDKDYFLIEDITDVIVQNL